MLIGCLALLAAAPPALADDADGPTAFAAAGKVVSVRDAGNGAKRLTYRVGPFNIKPGQNEIGFEPIVERPQVNGWITRTIVELEEEMLAAADDLRFEYAAKLRDEIKILRRELDEIEATARMGREPAAQ